jgi:hypothetical protein
MAREPDGGGLRGPERPRHATPAARGANPESPRGAAYTPPPPAEGPAGSGNPSRSGRWWIAAALGLALVGGVLYRDQLGIGGSSAPAAVQVAPRTIGLGAADIDLVATELARRLIAAGELPPPPPGATPATTAGAPADAAPANGAPATTIPAVQPQAPTETPATAPPVPATPEPAPVVHRPPPAPDAPAPATPTPAPAAETEQAVRQVLAQAPAEVRQEIAEGRTVIYSLHVLDDVVEDGDVVEVFVNGASQGRVLLSSAGQDLLVPLPAGSTAQVHVVATDDGGGGVTFGVTTSMGEIRSTVMAVGQSDDWSVSVQ